MSRFILRIDDIAPGMAWGKLERLTSALNASGVRPIVGVVPDCRDPALSVQPAVPDFWDRVRAMRRRGWSIAQHGLTHVYDTDDGGLLKIGTKSEFAGHGLDEQLQRVRAGKAILVREGCWQPFFMAPSHSFDEKTLRALGDEGFVAITDGYGLFPYRQAGMTMVPQLFSRPFTMGIGVYTVCLHLNSMDDQSLDRMAHFLHSRGSQFIGFDEVLAGTGEHRLLATVSRYAAYASLRSARRLRASMAGRRGPVSGLAAPQYQKAKE